MTHSIPKWLRERFDEIELEAFKSSGMSVFTQMRTKVQAYFDGLQCTQCRTEEDICSACLDAERKKFESTYLYPQERQGGSYSDEKIRQRWHGWKDRVRMEKGL